MRKRLPTLREIVRWEGPFEAYSRKWASQHAWRVRQIIGSDEDAVQHCALVFSRCLNAYDGTPVNNPAWFMSLYKRALANEWHTLSVRDSNYRRAMSAVDESDLPTIEHAAGPFAARIMDASDELRVVLAALADAPLEMLQSIFSGKSESATNRALCRWSGIRYGAPDLLAELRQLLS